MTNLDGEITNTLLFNKIEIRNNAYLFCENSGDNYTEVFFSYKDIILIVYIIFRFGNIFDSQD